VLVIYPAWILNRPSDQKKAALRRFFSWSQTAQAEKLEPMPQVLVALVLITNCASRSSCSRFQRPPDTGSSSRQLTATHHFGHGGVVFVGDFIEVETVLKPDNHPAQTRAISDRSLRRSGLRLLPLRCSVKTNGRVFQFNVFSDLFGNSFNERTLKNSTAN
jgi:hypothetical protein